MRKVGRPLGHKLNKKSKDKIALSASGKKKSRKTKKKTAHAVHRYNLCLKRNIIRGVLKELEECELLERISKAGVIKQCLYSPWPDVSVMSIEIKPISGKTALVEKKVADELKMRSCPFGGWNIGAKLFVMIDTRG